MLGNVIAVIAVSMVFGYAQLPPLPPWPDDILTLPTTTLPWPLPDMPLIDLDLDIGTPTFNELEHSDEYAGNIAILESNMSEVEEVVTDADTELDSWLGPTASIPDLSGGGDFDTGIDVPGYEDASAYDVADEMGTNIGTLFAHIRALASLSLSLGGIGIVIGMVGLCIAWMGLVTMIKFAVQLVDMITSLIVELVPLVMKIFGL